MTDTVFVLNGPNLNLLGSREPRIYGTQTLADIEATLEQRAKALKLKLDIRQSNHEGVLVDLEHDARDSADALIINPAGYSFTSIALLDALKTFGGPIIELHISNIHARDELHRHSILSGAAKAVICGLGTYGYVVAMQAAAQMLGKLTDKLPAVMRHGPR